MDLLSREGSRLGRPHVDTLYGSKLSNLKELIIQYDGHPIRILFVFDPRRVGYLILGGDKTSDNTFYDRLIPLAEKLYKQHIKEIPHGEQVE